MSKKKESWNTAGYRRVAAHIDEKHNNLIILEILKERNKYKQLMAICRCELCGGSKPLRVSKIIDGTYKSCGCQKSLNPESYIGKTFGELTILKSAGVRCEKTFVLCQCSCGTKKELGLSVVIGGNTRSCGHLKAADNPEQYIGNTYGQLRILSVVGVVNHAMRVNCVCSCGSETTVKLTHVLAGYVKSCGCLAKLKNPEQYIGKRYGSYYVKAIVDDPSRMGRAVAECVCDCSNIRKVKISNLLSGAIVSCGCAKRTRDGLTSKNYRKFYNIWRSMLKRCYQSGNYKTSDRTLAFLATVSVGPSYSNYGARGIKVCPEWHDPKVFIKWYVANIKEGESMDRIDNDGDYTPENMRSATAVMQANNQRPKKTGSSGYTGIYKIHDTFTWVVRYNNKTTRNNGVSSLLKAVIDRNIFIVKHELPNKLNHPNKKCSAEILINGKNPKIWKIRLTDSSGNEYISNPNKLEGKLDSLGLRKVISSLTD